MKQLVIVGQPLGHSLSPVMHNAALAALGLDADYHYRRMPMNSAELPSLVDAIKKQTIAGANVTIPYKSEILAYLPLVEEESRILGSVNTIYNEGDHVVGGNTDVFGFRQALREHGVNIPGLRASILGAGGAARAVAYALAEDGAERIEILYRTRPRAEELVKMLQSKFDTQVGLDCSSMADYAHLDANLVVNCTPVGMRGHSPAETPLKPSSLTEDLVVMDLVYNPLRTRLLAEAQKARCKTIGGVEMLVYQGAASLELWTGRKPSTAVMKHAVLDVLGGEPDG